MNRLGAVVGVHHRKCMFDVFRTKSSNKPCVCIRRHHVVQIVFLEVTEKVITFSPSFSFCAAPISSPTCVRIWPEGDWISRYLSASSVTTETATIYRNIRQRSSSSGNNGNDGNRIDDGNGNTNGHYDRDDNDAGGY